MSEQPQSEHQPDKESDISQDIAIVGIAIRVPGAVTLEQYWDNLRNGVESIEFYGDEELAERGVSSSQIRNPHYVKAGAPLPDMEYFDAEFFGFSPKEGGILDPQHRQFYECAWEALEDAGHPPEKFDGAIGVFAGCGMGAYFAFNLITNPDLVSSVGMFLLRHTGNDKDFLSSRVSYSFDLKGPSVNVQTACSTSLVATHLACQSLLSGESDMALAGGSTIEIPHRVGYQYKEGEILSPDGHCRAFDHRSRGTVFGSGTGLVVLRRLEDALKDGDQVYAVIKGTAVNNDGSGKVGYLAPSVDGQAAAIVEALAVADVEADSIGYVECHGTGTPVGDPIEVSALTQAFRETADRSGFCGIGSVKTNIGHLDTAAGVASLIKATLAVKYGELPPSLNFEAPNPTIDFTSSPFFVNDRLQPWESNQAPRRAGVNSLGVGGTNAFAILEEFKNADQTANSATTEDLDDGYQCIVLSARNRKALDAQCTRLAAHFRNHPDIDLPKAAYTLNEGRRRFEHRRVLAASTLEEAAQLLEHPDGQRLITQASTSDRASLVFMFPGGGAQYLGMGQGLYATEPVYRESVDRGIELLQRNGGTDLTPLLLEQPDDIKQATKLLERPSVQLPAIFIVEIALTALLESRGITPEALIGHSMGENTAACVAGVLSYPDALGLVQLRGELMDNVPEGGMLGVELAAEDLRKRLGPDLDLASINSPLLSVASGPTAALERLAAELDKDDINCRRIPISIAAHSRMLEGILQPFRAYLEGVTLNPPSIPIVSNCSGAWLTDEQATDPGYWVEHLRNTVMFEQGIELLLDEDQRVLLEVGPGHNLSSLARHNEKAVRQRVIPALRHPEEEVVDPAHFAAVLGQIWACGGTLNTERMWPKRHRRRIGLPTYAFQHSRYWIEPGSATASMQPEYGQLEKVEDFDHWFYEPVWLQQGILADANTPPCTWLIFIDQGEIGSALRQRLLDRGHEVVTVTEGDAFYQLNSNEYRLSPEAGAEGYRALAKDLLASGKSPDRVLHLWMLTEEESFRPGSSFFHRNQEHGFYSLFFLARAWGSEGLNTEDVHWIVASNGMQQVEDEGLPYPAKATALGPCKVIPREFPGISCISVDLDLGLSHSAKPKRRKKPDDRQKKLLDMLDVEMMAKPDNGTIAYRDNVRWALRYQPVRTTSDKDSAPILRDGGVYLITGGLGGIGFELSRHLAAHHNAKLVLVNRTPLPERKDWSQWLKQHAYDDPVSRGIRQSQILESDGAEVLVFSGDVTHLERMREILDAAKSRFGTINGVFHAAGVVRDNLIPIKTQSEIEDVFAPKLYGTLVLEELLAKEQIDFLLLYSSTSTVIAPIGQVDYVAANAFLNAHAQSKNTGVSRRTIAVNWGVWNEVGMAAQAALRMGFGPEQSHSSSSAEGTRHPLLEKRLSLIEDERNSFIYITHLSPRTHWVLDQHRTATGQAILPGTAYIELIRAALSESGESGQFEIRDLFFLQALYIPDDASHTVRIRLRTNEEGYQFDLHSEHLDASGDKGWVHHAQARILLAGRPAADDLDVKAIAARCNVVIDDNIEQTLRTDQEAHLQFGPRWKVLRQAGYGDGEAFGNLALASEFEEDLDDLKLHPALLDIATGFAMKLIEGYASKGEAEQLWVPVSYGTLKYYRPLTRRIRSWIRNHGENSQAEDFARFDITLTDSAGRVLIEVTELMLRKLEAMPNFAEERMQGASIPLEHETENPGSEVRQLSPAEQTFHHNLTQGILPAEGMRAIERILNDQSSSQVIVSSLDLEGLIAETDAISIRQTETASTKFERPELDSDFVAARNDIERTLVGIWEELLGVDQVGVQDSFFDLGGHSLIAVRLFARIKQAFSVDYPISILFQAPTIEGCATMIREEIGDQKTEAGDGKKATEKPSTRYKHLVPMHPGDGKRKTPFFLVAGMFGNVLNLRHLAHLIGSDREFYGLQARGLYGDQEPHATFEEMARDYIKEMKTVQPSGPYLLGGFSGGGITAYEIARQLLSENEEIGLLAMLDTPLPQSPPLSSVDRMSIHWQRLRANGASYFSEWARNRYRWELQNFERRFKSQEPEKSEADFHSEHIEVAFRSALDRYELKPLNLEIALLRPKLDESYSLTGGRSANRDRVVVEHDNGWSGFVDKVEIVEVPGDHDSMVLEPNVRVLAARLKSFIEQAETVMPLQIRESA